GVGVLGAVSVSHLAASRLSRSLASGGWNLAVIRVVAVAAGRSRAASLLYARRSGVGKDATHASFLQLDFHLAGAVDLAIRPALGGLAHRILESAAQYRASVSDWHAVHRHPEHAAFIYSAR